MTAFQTHIELVRLPHMEGTIPLLDPFYFKPVNLICLSSKICPHECYLDFITDFKSECINNLSALIWVCNPPLWKQGIIGIPVLVRHSEAAMFSSEVFDKRKVTVSLHAAGSTNGDSNSSCPSPSPGSHNTSNLTRHFLHLILSQKGSKQK